MRVIDCPCGHRLEAETDDELFRLAREHVARDHPEMQRTDEEIWQRVHDDAYDAPVRSAWSALVAAAGAVAIVVAAPGAEFGAFRGRTERTCSRA